MRISRKPPRICDVPLVSPRVSPIPPLRCKNASPDFSANFKPSLARLRILVKVLNGRQRVGFGQKAEAWRTWRANLAGPAPNNVTLLQRAAGLAVTKHQKLLTRRRIATAKARTSLGNDP